MTNETPIEDLVKLKDIMHGLADSGFSHSDKCIDVCPCFPYCQTHAEDACYQLIAKYFDKELSRILRRLDGD